MAKDNKHNRKGVHHPMVNVLCPQNAGKPTPANPATKGPRCTKCGQQGHALAG